MSWKSETRRKVEFMLDVYAAGNIGDANLTAGLAEVIDTELSDTELSTRCTMDFVRACGDLAGHLKPGILLSHAQGRYLAALDNMIPRPLVDAEAKERIEFLCRVIAAREIERGLLG